MKKPGMLSPRSYFWIAGFLILTGTMLVTFTYFEHACWYALNPSPSRWLTEFDQYFHGVLSASNTSVDLQLDDFFDWELLELRDMFTNNTPITIVIRNGTGEIVFQLVNCTAPQDYGPYWIELYGGLTNETGPATVTVSIFRVTNDVRFGLRILRKSFLAVYLAPPPFYLFAIGYISGILLIIGGFFLLDQTTRRYYND